MQKLYLSALIAQIRRFDKVAQHPQLKAPKWTKSCYEILADIVSEQLQETLPSVQQQQMGVTISAKTLSSIFKGQYKLSYPLDPRSLNTLNKIVFSIGYSDWAGFTESVDASEQEKLKTASPEEAVEFLLREAIDLEYKAYAALPDFNEQMLSQHYSPDGPAVKRIFDVLVQSQIAGKAINNPYNPSSYEILDLQITKLEGHYAQARTNEYWLLCWWSAENGKYVQRFKDISEHHYVLVKDEHSHWKVRTNACLLDFNTPPVHPQYQPEAPNASDKLIS